MIVYYENMNGEKLNLLKAPFRTTKTDWFDAVRVFGRIRKNSDD